MKRRYYMAFNKATHYALSRKTKLITPKARINTDGNEANKAVSVQCEKTRVTASLIRHGIAASTLLAATLANAGSNCGGGYTLTATLGRVTRTRTFAAGATIQMEMGE